MLCSRQPAQMRLTPFTLSVSVTSPLRGFLAWPFWRVLVYRHYQTGGCETYLCWLSTTRYTKRQAGLWPRKAAMRGSC